MAVNAIEVLYLTSGLFKAVPSKVVLTDLAKATNLDTLAKDLGNTPYAINAFPVTSNAEKAKVLAENLLGSSVTDKTAAVTALEGVLNANGGNVGVAALIAIKEILKGGTYADAKAQLENRVKVAEAYVNSPRGTEISTSILNEVTKDAATATAAIEKLNSNNTPGGDYAGTPNDDTVSLLGGLASTIKIEGGQQGAAGDTLVITAQASATANVINLQNFADQNQTLDAQQRKVSPIIQGFENVDATASTTEMNITGRDRTSELNTGSVASTQTGSVLKGGAYRDTVTGAAGADSIEGNAGNDVLNGGAGNDTIKGGADNDSITGGTGNDTIEDGTGNDTVSGGADNDTITIGGGVDLINGDEGNDTISFAADAAAGTSATVRTTVNGGAGNDSIDNTNATAASFLQVSGGANNDKITLGVATENINAGANNDIIVIKQAALDQVGTVAAGDLDVLNGNDGQDALQLLLTSGDATTTFRLTPVTGQYSGFEVIELIDESGNTNAKTYKIDLTDDFVANNFVNGQFLIDARGLPAGSNLVIDTSALTAASAARFTAGAFQVWTSPSTDIRDQLNKTIDANYAINASNAALNATRAFYTNSSDTTNKAGVHDATTGLITTTPAGATAYTVVGGNVESATGGVTTGLTFALSNTNAILTTTANANATPAAPSYLTTGADTINAGNNLSGAFISDATPGDGDVLNAAITGGALAATPTIAGIETINLTTNQTAASSLLGVTGATTISISGGTSSFTDAQNQPLALAAGYAAGLTANVTTVASQGIRVTLNGTTAGAGVTTSSTSNNTGTNPAAIALTVAANSTLSTLDAGAVGAVITVAGAGNLTVADATTTGTVNASAMTGTITFNDISNTVITGSNQADSFTQATVANASVNGGGGNDTFNFGTVYTAADSIDGGTGTDTLNITNAGTVTLTNVSNVENIVLSGSAADLTFVTANQALGQTLNVNASGMTGALTTNALAASDFFLNVTGSAQADTLAGTNRADTITGGNGSDTITGGAGNDTVVLTETTAAVDHVRFAHSGVLNRDTVTGFTAGSDIIGLSIGNIVDNGGANDTLSTANGTDIGAAVAAGAATASFTGAASAGTALANGVNLIILSNTAATSFATAIGTTTFTNAGVAIDTGFTAGVGIATVWYDTTNGQAVFGYIENTSTVTADVLSAADTFHEVVRVGMTSADFTQVNITNSFALF